MRHTRPSDKNWKTLRAYFVLLRKGFSARDNHLLVCALLPHIFTLTTGFHPWRYILCGTFRRISPPTLVFFTTLRGLLPTWSSDFPHQPKVSATIQTTSCISSKDIRNYLFCTELMRYCLFSPKDEHTSILKPEPGNVGNLLVFQYQDQTSLFP